MVLGRVPAFSGRSLSATLAAGIAVTALCTLAIGFRFGYQPDAGSHRVEIRYDGSVDVDQPASFRFAPALGRFATQREFTLDGWTSSDNGSLTATRTGATATFSGPMDAISRVFWRVSDSDSVMRLSIDGNEPTVLSSSDRTGVETIDLPLSVPHAFFPLLLAVGGLVAAGTASASRQVSRAVAEHSWRRVLKACTACLVGGALTIGVWQPPPASTIRYDIEVIDQTPAARGDPLTVRLRDTDGHIPWALNDSTVPGWTATASGMRSDIAGQPFRVVTVASPASRLDVFGAASTATVTVNGRSTTIRPVGPDNVLSPRLDELAGSASLASRTLSIGGRAADVLLIAAAFGVVVLCVRAGRHRLARRGSGEEPAAEGRLRHRTIASYALMPAAGWGSILAIFWPGIMTPDSLWQWRQLDSGQLSNWHPYTMALVVGLLRKVYGSPWVPILLVLVAGALLVGAIATLAERRGCPAWIVRMMTVGVTLCPPLLLMTSVLWKDVVIGVATLALVLAIWLLLERSPARLRDQPTLFALLIGSGIAMWLSRHNAWPVVLGTIVIIALARHQIRAPLLLALVAICAISVAVTGPVARLMNVEPSPVGSIVLVQRVSAHLDAGTRLEPNEIRLLESIRPLDEPWPYSCSSVFATLPPSGIPIDAYSGKEAELRNLVIRLALRAPDVEIRHIACSSKIVWQVSGRNTRTGFVNLPRHGDIVDSITRPLLDAPLEQPASRRLAAATFDTVSSLPSPLLRPAIYTYGLVAAVIVACRRRRSLDPFLIILPAALQTLILTPVVLVQDTRFQYGVILVAAVMTPLLLTVSRDRSGRVLSWTRSSDD